MQTFMFLAIGIGALLVALALTLVLLRLNRTLFVIEAVLETLTDEMKETLPEVRQSLGNVNEITAGMNAAMRQAGSGLETMNGRLRRLLQTGALDAAAAWHGVRVASRSLSASYAQQDLERGAEASHVSHAANADRKEDSDGEG